MRALTSTERILRGVMIEAATDPTNDECTLTYTTLGEKAKAKGCPDRYPMLVKPFRGLGEALGNISTYEDAFGRPLLTALVVQSESRRPGAGFFDLAHRLNRLGSEDPLCFWKEEVAAVRQFWGDADPTRIIDAAIGGVLQLLRQIRRDL